MTDRLRPVVVTGAGGFVGGAVCRALAPERRVLAVARRACRVPCERLLEADLTAGLPDARDFEGSVVVHAAAAMGTQDRAVLWASNVDATRRVAEWAVAHKAAGMVFVSSGGVYPYARGRYWTELDKPDPIGYYGHTKYLGEELLRAYHRLDGLPVTALRLFFPYGPGQERGVSSFIAQAVRAGTEITVQGPGEPTMNPVHVDDCVDAVRRVGDLGPGFRIYNLSGDRPVSFLDLVRMEERSSGKAARLRNVPSGPGDLLGANDLLKRETGWTPRHVLPAG